MRGHDADEAPVRGGSPLRSLVVLIVALAVVGGLGVFGWRYLKDTLLPQPPDGCTVTVGEHTVFLTPEQAKFAAIIVGEAQRRGLPQRAMTIALATAYQESGIRNLNYGDRDSLGLFQQRPSQGWGTPEQIMDPWYSSGKFYAGLVKVKNWQTMDINDAAQKVQISAYPNAYRKHVPNAEAISAALSGRAPGALACRNAAQPTGNPAAGRDFLRRALPDRVKVIEQNNTLTLKSQDPADVWSGVQLLLANTAETGVERAQVGTQQWCVCAPNPDAWEGAAASDQREGSVTYRSAATPGR